MELFFGLVPPVGVILNSITSGRRRRYEDSASAFLPLRTMRGNR
jgi:hypothetical protein